VSQCGACIAAAVCAADKTRVCVKRCVGVYVAVCCGSVLQCVLQCVAV